MVNGQGIITVYITEESKQQRAAEGPWLALVVAEIFDFQTYFFHYFTVYGFFDGFPDFCETCNQSIAFEVASLIFGEDDLIFVCNPHNNSRAQNRIFVIATGRAFHHTFLLAVNHWFSAAATMLTIAVPLEQLMSCNPCKCQMLRMCSTQNTYILEFIVRKKCSIQMWDQIKALVINGEEVDIVHIKIIEPFL